MIKKINYLDTLPIRQAVLWPNKELNEVMVTGDEEGIHYGYYLDEKLVAVISGFIHKKTAQFRKFCCLKEFQNSGYGTLLLNELLSEFEKEGITYVWCNARKTAIDFYSRFGFEVKPNSDFKKGNVSYVIMKKDT